LVVSKETVDHPAVLSIPLISDTSEQPRLLWWRGRPCSIGASGADAFASTVAAGNIQAAHLALQEVDGAFAVAWVSRWGEILLATDRFAIESLCWRVVGQTLHIDSRADSLAALAPEADIDPAAIFDFLYHHVIPSPRTVFSGVHRLPASHSVALGTSAAQLRRYWIPSFRPQSAERVQDLAGEFKKTLEEGTRRAVAALDAPLGCYLSGGTDSSTVAGMLTRATGAAVDAYSIGFEAEGYDEMEYARIAARHFGCRHHEHYVTTAELTRHLPAVSAHFDQPFGNSSALPAFLCATMAKGQGMRALLAGDGGDELFGGNARYAKQSLFALYGRLPGPIRRGVLEPVLAGPWADAMPLTRKAKSYIEQARLPMPDRGELYNLLLRTGLDEVLEPGFRQVVDEGSPLRHQQEVWRQVESADELNRTLAFDWRYTLAECDLPKVVESARLADVSVGFPLLDRELLEFSMRLPVDFKLRGQQLRWFFKEALSGFLPEQIIRKQKHGFGLPFGVWCLRDPALHKLATESLTCLGRRGIVRPRFVGDLLNHKLGQHPGYYGEFVWILCVLELWLQKHRPTFAMR
jgi:asparagine synthase (glutamine-hydrolysing)